MTRKTLFTALALLLALSSVALAAGGTFEYTGAVESRSTTETASGTIVHVTLTDKAGGLTVRCSGLEAQLACLQVDIGAKARAAGQIIGGEHVATTFQEIGFSLP